VPVNTPRFEYIFYIHASSAATISRSYADIASTYGLGGGTVEELRNKAMRWIEGLPAEWLMIFDNWTLSERRGHIPGRNKGNIIYTSRSSELCKDLPSECVYEVTPFGEADAVNLLLKASDTNAETSEDRALAEAIVQELGCLPLAIGNAAASIKESRYPLHKYLKRIRDEKVSILSNPRFGKEKEKVENWTVYASLELSYEDIMNRRRQAGRDGPGLAAIAALKVLNLLCFYHPTSIKLAILGNAVHEYHTFVRPDLSSLVRPNDPDLDRLVGLTVNGLWSGRFILSGLNLLRKFHLVKVDNDFQTISMHDLIHAWARHRMETETVAKWGLVAKVLLIESIPMEDPLKSNTLLVQASARRSQPHFDMCLKNSEPPRIPFSPEYESLLLGKLALYYRAEHDFEKAKKCLLERLHIEKMQCMSGIIVVITLIELGQLNHEMGCLGEAELMFLTAIEILRWEYERVTDGERVSRLKNQFLRVCANHIPSLTQTLSMHARISGGVLFESVSNSPKESLKGKERAASMGSQNPPDIPENYIVMNNFIHGELGRVYMDQGRYGMGRRMLCKAVENLGELLDDTDPRYLRLLVYARCETDYDNLEFWTEFLTKLDAAPSEDLTRNEAVAEALIAHAFSIVAKYPEHWEIPFEMLEGMCPGFTKAWGFSHRVVLKTMRHQVHCLIEGFQYDRAVDLAKRCVERAKEGYGEFHMETFKAQEILSRALFYQRMKPDEENRAILQEAFEKSAGSLGLTHPTTKQIQRRLERFLSDDWVKDDLEFTMGQVRGDLQKKFEESVISLGPNHPTTKLLQHSLESTFKPVAGDAMPKIFRELNKEFLANCIMEWQIFKQMLAESRAEKRPQRQWLHRLTHLVGDGPPRSPAEQLERWRAAFGPNDPEVKSLEEAFERRQAMMARLAGDGWWPSRRFFETRSLGEEGAQMRPFQVTRMTAMSSMTAKRRKASGMRLDHTGIAASSQESKPEEIIEDNELGEDIAGESVTQAVASAVAGELVGESSGTQR
jgi:tetratricopeptide (TPR) repeat protein